MKIYKYPIDSPLKLPLGAEILSANIQREEFFVWALVDPEETEMIERDIRVLGTGDKTYKYYNRQ